MSQSKSSTKARSGAGRVAAAALTTQFFLILATFIILSGAINWPARIAREPTQSRRETVIRTRRSNRASR